MDGLYGNFLELLESLQAQCETFLAEIHSDQHIYLTDPTPYLPPQGPGRPRVRYHSDVQPIEVRKWIRKQPASQWRKKTLRKTTKGNLIVEVLHQRVWLWDKYSPTAHCWHLIVRRELSQVRPISHLHFFFTIRCPPSSREFRGRSGLTTLKYRSSNIS
jgi:hypothetical protein